MKKMFFVSTILSALLVSFNAVADWQCHYGGFSWVNLTISTEEGPVIKLPQSIEGNIFVVNVNGFRTTLHAVYKYQPSPGIVSISTDNLIKIEDLSTWKNMPESLNISSALGHVLGEDPILISGLPHFNSAVEFKSNECASDEI